MSLPNLISTLHTFKDLSGLGVNLTKCSAMPINLPPSLTERLRDNFHFAWDEGSLQYLGIRLAPSLQQIYQTKLSCCFHMH